MRYTLNNFILLGALLFSVPFLQSCTEEGCTDPNAENYNPDAEEDDGTCTFARTKFIGQYGAGESCDGAAATSIVVSIAESTSETNEISITNETINVTVTGIVSGDSFTIDDTFIRNGTSVNMVGSGSYTNADSDEKIDVEYTLTAEGQSTVQSCTAIWSKI